MAVRAYWRRFKMQSTSEGSRALDLMEAIWVVELWLSGAGEIGISFLSAPVVCVRWLRRGLNVGDCHLGITGLLAWTWDAIVEVYYQEHALANVFVAAVSRMMRWCPRVSTPTSLPHNCDGSIHMVRVARRRDGWLQGCRNRHRLGGFAIACPITIQ